MEEAGVTGRGEEVGAVGGAEDHGGAEDDDRQHRGDRGLLVIVPRHRQLVAASGAPLRRDEPTSGSGLGLTQQGVPEKGAWLRRSTYTFGDPAKPGPQRVLGLYCA